jgi:hypothetical protein
LSFKLATKCFSVAPLNVLNDPFDEEFRVSANLPERAGA